MKGEIFRRMSLEIIKNDGVENVNKVNEIKKVEKEDDKEDYLVETIGAFGLWQALVSVTVMLTRLVASWNLMSLPFLTPTIEFVCVEFSANVTTVVKNSTCYDNCLKYEYSSAIGRSIIEDFDLICQNKWLASFAQSAMMFGMLLGASLYGWISDRFGRRTALLQSTFLNGVFMVALPFSPSYIVFTSIRFVIGVATGGSLLICLVHIMEIIGKQHRGIAGACSLIPDGLAQSSLAGFAYFTSDWRGYTLSYGAATWLIFILILFIPESPRWLIAHGKIDEAINIVTRAANRNKLNTNNIKDIITKAVDDIKIKDHQCVKTSYLDFFKTKVIFLITLVIVILWLALGMCYFGIYQYITITGVDVYLTVVISGVIQIPVCPVGIFINQKFGRKSSVIGSTFGIAITMFCLIFVPQGHWVGTVLGILGFISSSISFVVVYVYMSELYPTPLRNMSYGMASVGSKIGAMIAPFVANLSPRWLPSVIFCIFPIVSGLCCFYLPETKGQNLKDTVDK